MGLEQLGFFPLRRVRRGRIVFGFCSLFVVPEGDFVFDSEFNAAVATTSTFDAAFIVAELSKKLAHASRILMQKAKANADREIGSS